MLTSQHTDIMTTKQNSLTLTLPGPSGGVSGSLDSYCSLKPLCSGMGEVVPARIPRRPYFPHPLALCCHYPVSKYCSASIVVTSTVRVKKYLQINASTTSWENYNAHNITGWHELVSPGRHNLIMKLYEFGIKPQSAKFLKIHLETE